MNKNNNNDVQRGLPIIIVQLSIALVSFVLPVWGLATTNKYNNLSPLESVLLRSRLEGIKNGIKQDYSTTISKPRTSTSTITTLIFPGAGGVDDLVLELQNTVPDSIVVDWKEYRGNFLFAAYDSESVGASIAELILNEQQIKKEPKSETSSIHFIGISVGAFAANAAATIIYRRKQPPVSNVHLTLLDPFCGRGVLGSNYGKENFGKYATTALQILNTDDPVPTTNDPLPFCSCLDVTDAPERKDFMPPPGDSMHSWPVGKSIQRIGILVLLPPMPHLMVYPFFQKFSILHSPLL